MIAMTGIAWLPTAASQNSQRALYFCILINLSRFLLHFPPRGRLLVFSLFSLVEALQSKTRRGIAVETDGLTGTGGLSLL
eukprot:m.44236 g.44236  ORF g.44236 m.44236 type:complete len:80 (-) comp46944_c0_seq3:129-368(-)